MKIIQRYEQDIEMCGRRVVSEFPVDELGDELLGLGKDDKGKTSTGRGKVAMEREEKWFGSLTCVGCGGEIQLFNQAVRFHEEDA